MPQSSAAVVWETTDSDANVRLWIRSEAIISGRSASHCALTSSTGLITVPTVA